MGSTDTSSQDAGYQFTFDWFSAKIPVWLPFFGPNNPLPISRVLEIGSFEGRSAVWMIEQVARARALEIYCVDSWQGSEEHREINMAEVEKRFDHNIALAAQCASHPVAYRKYKGRSFDALVTIINARELPFDFIYIDGSHVAQDVIADAVLSYELLRIGGILAFDDYHWVEPGRSWEERRAQNEPKVAIDSFQLIYASKLSPLKVATTDQLFLAKLA